MAEGEKGPLARARERLVSLVRGQDGDDAGAAPTGAGAGAGSEDGPAPAADVPAPPAAVPAEAATAAPESAAGGAEQVTPRVPRGAVRASSAKTGEGAAAHAEAAAPAASSDGSGPPGVGDTRTAELGEQLSAVADLLEGQLDVRRALADSGSRERSRVQLVDRLFGGQLSNATLDVLRELVAERWPTSLGLVLAIDKRASTALLSAAGDDLDDVEDELFRFSRTVERESRLSLALSDPGLPAERKDALLERLLEGKAHPTTVTLVRRVVHHPRGRSVPRALEDLARMAADLHQRSIAEVTVASQLDADQTERLRQAVSAAFDREVELQVFVDPTLLGGVVVRVGDEVVDGSILRRLADARRQLVR
jgi:F-type H+-transporting ATPase subunit delta